MAYAMQQAGILVGLILLVVMGIITDYSLILLNKCSQITGANSYQGVMNAAFGCSGYVVISFLQFVYPFIGNDAFFTKANQHLLLSISYTAISV